MNFQDFQPIAAIATTPAAIQRLQPLTQTGTVTLWVPDSLLTQNPDLTRQVPSLATYSGALKAQLARIWKSHQSFIFCLATGATVRLIAPLLEDKATDPAIVVLDEAGKFVISLCGGHRGGADQLARLLALHLDATPVLTGAANRADLPGIDVLGLPFGWRQGDGDWTGVSAAIARNQPVQVIQQAGSTLWQQHLPAEHPFVWEETADVTPNLPNQNSFRAGEPPKAQIWITPTPPLPHAPTPHITWHPRVLWVGIGCERGTSKTLIEHALRQVFQNNRLAEGAIAGIATIDLKADEVGLVEFCRDQQLPLCCFSAEELRCVSVPNPSSVVAEEVGTPSVAEAAAILAAGGPRRHGGAKRETNSTSSPISYPLPTRLQVPKQIVRLEGQSGAVTIAIAQAEREYTGRSGKLWLVGTGPGQLDQITPAAKGAIAGADVVIGYSLYLDLIKPLLRPGQIVEASAITQERQRAERAIDLAEWGLTVAIVSSGDCGIYGMAGLALEQLQNQGWDGKTPEVQVFPGITALQSAASRVGAPLMHDFCAISLSDLLTPWQVIEKRLHAAAQADFVVALYNPKSQNRTQQIVTAQHIFLQYRSGSTPVALVRSAYRPDEQVTLTTLAELLNSPIDMLTTVLIGNQSSRIHADWFITPRGYLGFDGEGGKEEGWGMRDEG